MLNRLESSLVGIAFIAILIGFLVMLTGCDLTDVPEANRPTVDSLARLDSTRRADTTRTVRVYAVDFCVTGESKDRFGNPEPMTWGAEILIGRDTVALPFDTTVCRSIGQVPDTVRAKMLEMSSDGFVRRKYIKLFDRFEYDITWGPFLVRPDSLLLASDSINSERF